MRIVFVFLIIPIVLLLFLFGQCEESTIIPVNENVEVDTHSVTTGLDTPWEILWGPDSLIWFTERPGRVKRLDPETGELQLVLDIPDVYEQGESGLLGMALHPDFPEVPNVFLVYNYYFDGIRERVVRYSFNGLELTDPQVLLEGIAGAGNHNGSRLIIDKDYKLYVTTGDAGIPSSAQDLNSLNGKILRLSLDGSVPADNPFPGSYIWSYGHRNAQGLVQAPDGKIYSSEHGPSNDDEVNLIRKGGNYGWPDVQGFCDSPSEAAFCIDHDVNEPLYAWTPTLAVAGLDLYQDGDISMWHNCLLMTTLKEQELVVMKLGDTGENIVEVSVWFDDWFGRLRDVCVSPDGRVFLAVSNLDGRGRPKSGDDRIVQVKVAGP